MKYLVAFLLLPFCTFVVGQTATAIDSQKIQKIIDKTVDGKLVTGAQITIQKVGERPGTFNSGDISASDKYFIASTTKLYTSAIIYRLIDRDLITLDTKITEVLKKASLQSLHVFKGVDQTKHITVRHLLTQTSGIPDYFMGKPKSGVSLEEELVAGKDRSWSYDDALELSKSIIPDFAPGENGKALYSDTNYQLLGKTIEELLGISYQQALQQEILDPLGLNETYLYTNPSDNTPVPLRYKKSVLAIPQAMASFGPDGGIVSTSTDQMTFLLAFFDGTIFDKKHLSTMQVWNKVFYPLQYGVGVSRFKMMGESSSKNFPEYLGHSGLSGAFAWYIPQKKLFVTGTVNQIHKPSISFKMLARIVQSID